eukprot:SAG25_NODE_1821_length_2292_cov_2.689922_2_plen_404_part_01
MSYWSSAANVTRDTLYIDFGHAVNITGMRVRVVFSATTADIAVSNDNASFADVVSGITTTCNQVITALFPCQAAACAYRYVRVKLTAGGASYLGVSDLAAFHCTLVTPCTAGPCQNNGTCTMLSSFNTTSGLIESMYNCSCAPGYNGTNCQSDVNECDSSPCRNGAVCTDSTSINSTVSVNNYRCSCATGFTNGLCTYTVISVYQAACSVHESSNSSALSGNCDVDVNECRSNPCQNGATCTESSISVNGTFVTSDVAGLLSVSSIPVEIGAYRCSCVNGFVNGLCQRDWSHILSNLPLCTVNSSLSNKSSGNCDIDINECSSNPCKNSANCTESAGKQVVPPDVYQCSCVAGYANGVCTYNFISAYILQCQVVNSASNGTAGGKCDIDVDECKSNPCTNGATC